MLKDKPFVSVIVPFVDHDRLMEKCVKTILSLNYPEYELIIVSDEPQNIPVNNKVKHLVSGAETISQKRNLAMMHASQDTEIFAFIDSDAYPQKNWLDNAVKIFLENHDIDAVGGPHILPPDADIRETCASNSIKSPIVSGMKCYQNKISENRFVEDLPTCNLFIRKDMIDLIGKFNPELTTGEDLELCHRIISKGKKIYYSKDVVVYHHRRKVFRSFLKQRFVYGMSIFNLFKKEPCLKNTYLLLPPLVTAYLFLGIIICFFSASFLKFYAFTIILLALICLVEGFRTSSSFLYSMITSLNIFLTVFTPGLGAFYGITTGFDSKKKFEKR